MSNLLHILQKAHSGIRYMVLLFLVLALLASLIGWFSKGRFTKANKVFNTFTVIFTHTQALIGLILYFAGSYYASGSKYLKMEHVGTMLLAVILITIGNSKSKKAVTTAAKHRSVAIFFGLALAIIIVTILRMVQLQLLPSFLGSK